MITQIKAMPTKSAAPVLFESENEDNIRDYAHHLYLQSGGIPGRDLDNWLEAKACLDACVPKSESHTRLHQRAQTRTPQTTAATKPHAA